ncbi:MAG TPA: hypothetical protein VHG70_12155 [Nocardioidaceae bacterium]|nr:hypothetical protein [Nocardioidaceae bacterium]
MRLDAPPQERALVADELLDRLTPVMSVLGLLFLLVVLGERLAAPGSAVSTAMAWTGWVLWAAFVAEFVLRVVVAPDRRAFLRRNWWQILFLVLPFLRFLRLFRAVKLLRAGRVLSSTIRSSRSARRVLGDRVGWLSALTAIIVLASSQLLYEFGDYARYGDALHAAALAAITGEPLAQPGGFAQVMEILLAVYSVAVFATLAGTLGAYFLRSDAGTATPEPGAPDVSR